MTRAHFYRPVQNEQGALRTGLTVTLRDPGTTNPISQSIYSSSGGGTTRTNPWSVPNGIIDFYLDPRQVDILVSDTAGAMVTFFDIDVGGGGVGGGGGGATAITVQDEGVALATAADTINFVGEKVTATGTGATKTITVATPTNSDVGAIGYCIEASGTYPGRPASTAPILFMGADQPASGGTTAGGAGAVNGLDIWFKTA